MKTDDFDYFVLSIFDVGDIKAVTDAIEKVKEDLIRGGQISIDKHP